MAAGKLQEVLPQRPITYKGQNLVNLLLLVVAISVAGYLVMHPEAKISVSGDGHDRIDFRRAADYSDRRRGHADGHLALEFLRWIIGGGDGLCAEQ